MKIKFNSDDDLPLKKKVEIRCMTIVVMALFHDNNKYHTQILSDECLYKL